MNFTGPKNIVNTKNKFKLKQNYMISEISQINLCKEFEFEQPQIKLFGLNVLGTCPVVTSIDKTDSSGRSKQ